MATYKLTPKEIYETDFNIKMRGYDKDQVDEMLDSVIVDYENFQAEILRLQEENEFLKNRVADLEQHSGNTGKVAALVAATAELEQTQRFDPFTQQGNVVANMGGKTTPSVQIKEPSNFDLLKRINRLERAVFGPDSKFGEAATN
ncbi:DivIVA domain-containing protein [Lactovum miscens]|uniref:DivIVA domain-containing protein n=1 Tax=Lactovum miscens TaxID=190387 RepID=A0A841C612_9LACT|nr:DivIVA domain-containing protein [Lactovum miscens]MBB5887784.1 DivIVA domain-containing protein [Lactovum miscens]